MIFLLVFFYFSSSISVVRYLKIFPSKISEHCKSNIALSTKLVKGTDQKNLGPGPHKKHTSLTEYVIHQKLVRSMYKPWAYITIFMVFSWFSLFHLHKFDLCY